jgi:hypothetical protein
MLKEIRIDKNHQCHCCHASEVDGIETSDWHNFEILLCSYCMNTYGADNPKGLPYEDKVIQHMNRMMNILEKRLKIENKN